LLVVGAVGLGGWLSACSRPLQTTDAAVDAATEQPPSLNECLTDVTFDKSQPPTVDAGSGWSPCCLRQQTRLCPPTPQVACNYGRGTTFNADGTCGPWSDASVTDVGTGMNLDAADAADASIDQMPDVTNDGNHDVASDLPTLAVCLSDSGFDMSLPPDADAGAGWSRCCLRKQTRLCPPTPPLVACNYGFLTTFNPDGTCGFNFPMDASSPDGSADANVTAP
jgi:hypothetical protein